MAAYLHVILTLAFLLEVESNTGFCVDNKCYSVYQEFQDFSHAKKACEGVNGHLVTVQSNISNSRISTLLSGLHGDFWIGLHFDGACPQPTSGLKGYKWITGQETDFRNWDKDEAVCPTSEKCVTVSNDDLKWRERSCTDKVDGFICEFDFEISCQPLQVDSVGQIQTYRTQFGFSAPDLTVLPLATVAVLNGGIEYICIGEWQKSPWNCEVFNGGCEYKCNTVDRKPVCICRSGYMLDPNDRSCSLTANDPCEAAGCAHDCLPRKEGFTCLCDHGFSLGADGKSCKDIDECADDRICPGEHMLCQNIIGSFKCICETGFETQKGVCMDIDECASSPCEHECINTPGNFNCSCYEGYKPSDEDRQRCVLHCPRQECPALCDPNEIYRCECPWGFVLDERDVDRFCVDIDECEMGYCDQHCDNSFGSYTCWCGEGYDLVDGACVSTEGSGITTSNDIVVTPTIKYMTESPTVVSGGGVLGIIVCVVCALLALVLLAHHCMKRRSEHSLIGAHKSNDLHDLEQITTENYKPNYSDIPSKGDR